MSHPKLFPTGLHGFVDKSRPVPINIGAYMQSRLWNIDDRFRTDGQYVFYALSLKSRKEAEGASYTSINSGKFTDGELKFK